MSKYKENCKKVKQDTLNFPNFSVPEDMNKNNKNFKNKGKEIEKRKRRLKEERDYGEW